MAPNNTIQIRHVDALFSQVRLIKLGTSGCAMSWDEPFGWLAAEDHTAYRVYVSPLDLETNLRSLTADASLVRAPGAWQPRAMLALDAFGLAGRYDRSGMARVYGARQPHVARGARAEDGRVVESWTLISPYPDAVLRRLSEGTLLVVLRLP